MLGLVRDALDATRSDAFLNAFLPFQARIARLGLRNSLAQLALKLTLPGVPDIYQGSELWELSLVDPDNRRPVDFAARAALLAEVEAALAADRPGALRAMLEQWQDGRIKLALTALLLGLRRDQPALFADGGYEPLAATGARADQLCAFRRVLGEQAVLVVAARFPARLEADPDWGDTALAAEPGRAWRDVLTGRRVIALDAATLLQELPVAVLLPD
jgi:(1->4)-alpha-D-glucan 1-alpha-D-glucosylmutase